MRTAPSRNAAAGPWRVAGLEGLVLFAQLRRLALRAVLKPRR